MTDHVRMKVSRRYNFCIPPHRNTEELTPLEKQFIIYHVGIPEIDAERWKLSIEGMVASPLELGLRDLNQMPQTTIRAFHECSGSPMRPFMPVRRIAQIEWSGVPLNTLLRRAGVEPGARYLWASGADHGIYDHTNVRVEEFQKDIPIEKAWEPEVLLATHANGAPLNEEHGGPVRLIVPGFYATCSVKWLTRLEAKAEKSTAYFAEELYNDPVVEGGKEARRRVWKIAPHSVFVHPQPHGELGRGNIDIWGWAWGSDSIAKVEVSVDGGASWMPTQLEPRSGWRLQRFKLDWNPPAPGEYPLWCRATDSTGLTQPESGARNEIFKIVIKAQ